MKRLMGMRFVLITLILLTFRPVILRADPYDLDAITSAIRSGDVNQLSPFLDARVNICLPDKTDSYSKTQAEMVIRDFFATHTVQGFKVIQQGNNGEYVFCSGLLRTDSGNYRTTLFFKQKGNRQVVQEIRFQPVE
ncbi:MAG TPA: DUF4783 domain-containing protein [Puia sp.]|nr:DUF4783 domain-containing protein [Puia sp.]